MSYVQLKRAIWPMIALVALAGCSSKIQYPSYYVLNLPPPVAQTNRQAPIPESVAVREFEAPRFLREGKIPYFVSGEQLGFYEYHRWAADPRRAVTSALIEQMQSRGVFQSVGLFDGRGTTDCLVTGAIDHLEEVDLGSNVSIEVGLSARLINLRNGEVLWQGSSSQRTKVDQHSVPGVVAEMSRDVEAAVESLVSSMQDRVSTASQKVSGLTN